MMPYEEICENDQCIYNDEDFDCNCSHGWQDGENNCPLNFEYEECNDK